MHEYRGDSYEGVTIVGYGVSLNVTDGKSTVEYNDNTDSFVDVLANGRIVGRESDVYLDADQLAWLESQIPWVESQIADDK